VTKAASTSDVPSFAATTLDELFGEVATEYPDRIAYIEGDERLTFAQWVARADSLADALSERGVRGGDVIAILLLWWIACSCFRRSR
jgi:non-ribosomal peptide synthetase component E (peptide arylation enzyme)